MMPWDELLDDLGSEWDASAFVEEGVITRADGKGMTIYADLDGDGCVDHVTRHYFSGGFEVWSSSVDKPSEAWGLPQYDTPERGVGSSAESRRNGRWTCVDWG